MVKNIVILGSTGSIGTQTLNIIRRNPDKFKVVGLTANGNTELLFAQAKEFVPEFVGITDKSSAQKAKDLFGKLPVKLLVGADALTEGAKWKSADTVVVAVMGMCGLKSVLSAAENKKTIALANKESLVAGGNVVMRTVKENGVDLLPVDSEHSAVWQALRGETRNLKRIILTASGGSFFGKTKEELRAVTPEVATKHPNWVMGRKITVDSSTMMNKGLEIIEARWLFDTTNIDYVIHKESIIHSMVEYVDGSIIAQMSNPNMELPIALALSYPERLGNGLEKFDFDKNLSFCKPDEENFPLPKIAKQCMNRGGTAPCVLNAANEVAVELFLKRKIGFLDIERLVAKALEVADIIAEPTLSDILTSDAHCREKLMRDYKTYIGSVN